MKRSDRRDRLQEIRTVADSLRSAPIDAPDFTSAILDRVDAERPFLAPSTRRKLHLVRWGLGGSVALVVLGVALLHRYAPGAANIASTEPAPISAVVSTVQAKAEQPLMQLRRTVNSVAQTDTSALLNAVATVAAMSEGEGAHPCCGDQTSCPAFCGPVMPLSAAVCCREAAPVTNTLNSVNIVAGDRSRSGKFPVASARTLLSDPAVRAQFFPDGTMYSASVPAIGRDMDAGILPK